MKNKNPGNAGLTKEFYKTFWVNLKTPLMETINRAFCTNIFSISQRQTTIKLIEEQDRDRRYIKIADQFHRERATLRPDTTKSPLKIMKNDFYFHLKSSFRSKDIEIFVLTFRSYIKTVRSERQG